MFNKGRIQHGLETLRHLVSRKLFLHSNCQTQSSQFENAVTNQDSIWQALTISTVKVEA